MTEYMKASKFKAQCLKVMDRVQKTRKKIVITKRNKPVAQLVPIDDKKTPLFGAMKGTGHEPIPIFAKHAFRVFSHIFQSHFLAYVFKYVLRSGSKICEKILQKSKFWNIGIGSCAWRYCGTNR